MRWSGHDRFFALALTLLCSIVLTGDHLAYATDGGSEGALHTAHKPPLAQERVVPFTPGVQIEALLRPSDSVLVIEDNSSPPLMVDPPNSVPTAEWLASFFEFIAVIRVVDKGSARTLTGDWIMSTVAAEITELLKGPVSDELRTGGRLLFSHAGGTVEIAGTQVVARISYLRPVEVGREYLVFGVFADESGEVLISGFDIFEIQEGKLRPSAVGRAPTSERFKGAPIDGVLDQIRRTVAEKRKGSQLP